MEKQQSILIRRFYRSDEWKIARAMKIAAVGGRCEKCGAIGTEVHHITHLTSPNLSRLPHHIIFVVCIVHQKKVRKMVA